jgi:hypothetical protein
MVTLLAAALSNNMALSSPALPRVDPTVESPGKATLWPGGYTSLELHPTPLVPPPCSPPFSCLAEFSPFMAARTSARLNHFRTGRGLDFSD